MSTHLMQCQWVSASEFYFQKMMNKLKFIAAFDSKPKCSVTYLVDKTCIMSLLNSVSEKLGKLVKKQTE